MSILTGVGVKRLRRVQLGRESSTSPGTEVACGILWRGQAVGLEDQRSIEEVEEQVGLLSGTDLMFTASLGGALSLPATPATFEQLVHVFEAGIQTVSPTTDGSGRVRVYPFPKTSQVAIKTYSIEAGNNAQAEIMLHSFVDSFTLSGKPKECLKVASNWLGQTVTAATFTTAPTLPTVEVIEFSNGLAYIDNGGGTIGTTQVSDSFIEVELSVKTGWKPVITMGNLYFTSVKNIGPEITLKAKLEHNARAETEKAAWRNKTRRLIRFRFNGSNLSTAGATYTTKALVIDIGGKYKSVGVISDDDGNDTMEFEMKVAPDTAAGQFCTLTLVNQLATINA